MDRILGAVAVCLFGLNEFFLRLFGGTRSVTQAWPYLTAGERSFYERYKDEGVLAIKFRDLFRGISIIYRSEKVEKIIQIACHPDGRILGLGDEGSVYQLDQMNGVWTNMQLLFDETRGGGVDEE